eukprot:TRINITY_DN894_c0_g2_i1.p1 TRINITY_DN894_c0_g2~~TRINITY_DN894_c0_g2_i1.p1  ORF type:complete len:241 (-),score=100.34 TRINITY_DN894_c0_g2_i1:9-731(-)
MDENIIRDNIKINNNNEMFEEMIEEERDKKNNNNNSNSDSLQKQIHNKEYKEKNQQLEFSPPQKVQKNNDESIDEKLEKLQLNNIEEAEVCSVCNLNKPKSEYSKTQLRQNKKRKCKSCIVDQQKNRNNNINNKKKKKNEKKNVNVNEEEEEEEEEEESDDINWSICDGHECKGCWEFRSGIKNKNKCINCGCDLLNHLKTNDNEFDDNNAYLYDPNDFDDFDFGDNNDYYSEYGGGENF